MATLADSLVSSSARRLTLRKRPDLTARQQRYQGRLYWVVKEPIGLQYFRFQEEEYAILLMLDGRHSLDDIKGEFESRFPPQKITLEELQQFIGTLHRSGLVLADAPGQGRQLHKRRDEKAWQEFIGKLSNILAVRFKGIDPDRILTWLDRHLWILFTRLGVTAWFVTVLSALALVLVNFDFFQSRLPTFHQFFNAENAIWLGIALGVTKVLHEFGHGLSCKHFGGECHEMGIMVLVLTPCLYCNVSDSWMLPNKWHRAMIGAAGMYVELFIAAVCTFVWWYSEPDTVLNQLCLSTMFVCSVSTVIFNGNPLLRYDGYYILSDILEIPNLRQKSTDIFTRKLNEWCLGLEMPDDPFLPQRNQLMFFAYAVASAVYRWIVTFSILFFLYKLGKNYDLQIIGQIIAGMSLWALLVQPLWKAGKFLYTPGRADKVKKPRLFATIAIVAAVLLAVLGIPLPYRVFTMLEIQPRDAAHVYVEVPGRLEEVLVKPGSRVTAGTVIARLSNLDVKANLAELEGSRAQLASEVDSLRRRRHEDSSAALQIESKEKSLASVIEQIAEQRRDLDRLVIRAPVAGTVFPPPWVDRQKHDDDDRLRDWSEIPLEDRNVGAFFKAGVPLCVVGDPQNMEAVLVIDQREIDFVRGAQDGRPGQKVDIKLTELGGKTFHGQIVEVASDAMKFASKQLSNKSGGALATKTDPGGLDRPLSPSYQARVPLADPEHLLRPGLTGQGKINAGWQPLGRRLWRYITDTFNFKM